MSQDIAIRVENLSKRYRIGLKEQMHDTFMGAVTDFLRQPIENFRRLHRLTKFDGDDGEDIIWALKDVSFEVKRGEVVGIIGRNGAGKSTLLKILARITEPTSGRAIVNGRIGSLLEVGTGMHQELTGRENVYLSGTILGMRKAEIDRKFDEIVAFADIGKFIDTPIKRYSSGMKVRLGFAIAAHLEPEILLVDEVLAVGDAAFQKKCLGKMGDVAREGRTVLFVSHNMGAIQNLCPRSILLVQGCIHRDGQTQEVVEEYLNSISNRSTLSLTEREDRRGEGRIRFTKIEFLDENYRSIEYAVSGRRLIIRLHYKANTETEFRNCRVSVSVRSYGNTYFLASTELVRNDELILKGQGHLDCIIDRLPLSKGEYFLDPFLESNRIIQDWVEAAARLSVLDGDFYGTGRNYPPGWEGKTVLVKHRWEW